MPLFFGDGHGPWHVADAASTTPRRAARVVDTTTNTSSSVLDELVDTTSSITIRGRSMQVNNRGTPIT
eukprot:3168261-Pyramimonas_sp.AAC.1